MSLTFSEDLLEAMKTGDGANPTDVSECSRPQLSQVDAVTIGHRTNRSDIGDIGDRDYIQLIQLAILEPILRGEPNRI